MQKEAVELLLKAIELKPNDSMLLSEISGMLGYSKLFDGDIAGAKELFEKSLSILPSYKIGFELELLK